MKQQLFFAKDMNMFLLLIHAFGQLECCLPPWYMKIDSNHFINSKMIYDNLESEISDIVPELHGVTGCDTTLYKFHVEKTNVFKNVYKLSFSLTLFKMLRLNITLAENCPKSKNICPNYNL